MQVFVTPWTVDCQALLSITLPREAYFLLQRNFRLRNQTGLSRLSLSNQVKWSEVKVAQSCTTLCDPRGYTVHGILLSRILEWAAFPFSRASSQPRHRTQVSYIAGRFFTSWTTREAQEYWSGQPIPSPVDFPNPGINRGLLHCRR